VFSLTSPVLLFRNPINAAEQDARQAYQGARYIQTNKVLLALMRFADRTYYRFSNCDSRSISEFKKVFEVKESTTAKVLFSISLVSTQFA
jgi:predicted RNA-binding protein with PUA-like domain